MSSFFSTSSLNCCKPYKSRKKKLTFFRILISFAVVLFFASHVQNIYVLNFGVLIHFPTIATDDAPLPVDLVSEAPQPTCHLSPHLLVGYSDEEVALFFKRPRPLIDCTIKYSSDIQIDLVESKQKRMVLQVRGCRTKAVEYAFFHSPGQGQKLHIFANPQIPWRLYTNITRLQANSSATNTSYYAIPVEDQDEILLVRCRGETKNPHLRFHSATDGSVATSQSMLRSLWLEKISNVLVANKRQPLPVALGRKNPMIIHLNYDSISRAHFRRMLPKTIALLDTIRNDERKVGYELFDFDMHHVIADNTAPNMLPFLYGWQPKGNTSTITQSLFEAMTEAGFVTAYIQDDCHSGLAKNKQLNPAHHSPNQAWCIAKELWSYSDISDNTRCLGNRPSSEHALEYITSFADAYPDNARYVFGHLADAHESSGTVVQTIDDALHRFIESLLRRDSPDTILLLSSDHGMRYGGWRRSQTGFLEHKLPPLYILMPRVLINNVTAPTNKPGPFDVLHSNTHLLNTKLDLHATLKHLIQWPLPLSGALAEPHTLGRSLFEPIPLNRTCGDAGIPEEFCVCLPWQLLSLSREQDDADEASKKKNQAMNQLTATGSVGRPSAERLAKLFAREINRMVPQKKTVHSYCAVLRVHQVLSWSSQQIEPHNLVSWNAAAREPLRRNIKVRFSTKSSAANGTITEWEGVVHVRAFGAEDLAVSRQQGFQPVTGEFPTEFFTVRSVERPSNWPPNCRNRAFANSLDPKYCVCDPILESG